MPVMVRSGSTSSNSSSSDNPHPQQAHHSPATEHLRQLLPWNSRSPSQDGRNQNQNQNQSPTSANRAAQAATGLAVLLGIAQQRTPPHPESHEYILSTSPNSMNGDRQHNNEASPLLGSQGDTRQPTSQGEIQHNGGLRARRVAWTTLTVLFVASLVFLLGFVHLLSDKIAPWLGLLPKNPYKAAVVILEQAPVIVRFNFNKFIFNISVEHYST